MAEKIRSNAYQIADFRPHDFLMAAYHFDYCDTLLSPYEKHFRLFCVDVFPTSTFLFATLTFFLLSNMIISEEAVPPMVCELFFGQILILNDERCGKYILSPFSPNLILFELFLSLTHSLSL
jgi:hypothetical protein